MSAQVGVAVVAVTFRQLVWLTTLTFAVLCMIGSHLAIIKKDRRFLSLAAFVFTAVGFYLAVSS